MEFLAVNDLQPEGIMPIAPGDQWDHSSISTLEKARFGELFFVYFMRALEFTAGGGTADRWQVAGGVIGIIRMPGLPCMTV